MDLTFENCVYILLGSLSAVCACICFVIWACERYNEFVSSHVARASELKHYDQCAKENAKSAKERATLQAQKQHLRVVPKGRPEGD